MGPFVATITKMSGKNSGSDDPFADRILKIQRFEQLYPDEFRNDTPRLNSSKLGHAARQQLDLYMLVRQSSATYGPNEMIFLTSLIPTMHTIIELLSKAIAFELDRDFNNQKTHNTWGILGKYVEIDDVLSEIVRSRKRKELILELEKGYIDLRYGLSHVFMSDEAIREFESLANDLLGHLRKLTGLPLRSMLEDFSFEEDRS